MLWVLGILLTYAIGGFGSYYLAYYLGWDNDPLDGYSGPPVGFFAVFWFIGLPILLTMTMTEKLRERIAEKKRLL
jgi:hypothetical protein